MERLKINQDLFGKYQKDEVTTRINYVLSC